ncbi:polysaccharide deacetylase family protein [Candidatus Woesearchaeota archaeon]|nr:polysaccharide deacetylase family protein [Candidatus Woesearchaeota archaeon]
MVDICFYFQVHQPFRMRKYSIFDIGHNRDYFDEEKNGEIMRKVAHKCYLPTNKLMLKLLNKHKEFKISYSISGVAIEQFEKYAPQVLESFKDLVATGRVEILSETYHHSLAYLYSKDEFVEQVKKHKKKIKEVFGVVPTVFRNTELVYNNEIAKFAEDMGYEAILSEGLDHVLGWRSPNFVYRPHTTNKIKLLMKNYKLSDDIAFRFSNQGWAEWPLTVDKFSKWVNSVNGSGEIINLFMDYETFGEHQWEDTGIFNFLDHLPGEHLKNPDNGFVTPSEAVKKFPARDVIDIHNLSSWADIERDLSAWLGNKIQQTAIKELYMLEGQIKAANDAKLLEDWRKLNTSDHFYYMCTKWFADGDVHKYFNPYDSPYDSYIIFNNILNDFIIRLKEKELKIKIKEN